MARPDVARLIEHGHSQDPAKVREKVLAYLEELRTTQRYPFYRALKHPLYPILRKIDAPRASTSTSCATPRTSHRVIYASNHKSHTDYLVEPLVLDDHGIRPPLIAAGINLFGGPLGLLHRHVTGAIPIRRNTKDPAYLITLKAYVAELLREHDLFFYPEGGRSYSGELKPPKTGLLHAALQAGRARTCVIVPTAIAYDLVLEDRVLARQGVKRRQRPFTHELAEMVRPGGRLPLAGVRHLRAAHRARRLRSRVAQDVLDLAHRTRDAIGRLYKVLPTALVASAMRPSITHADLASRVDAALEHLQAAGANLAVRDVTQAVEDGVLAPGAARRHPGGNGPAPRARPERPAVLRPEHPAPAAGLIHTIGRTHARRPLEVVLPRAGPEQEPRAHGLANTAWRGPRVSRAGSSPARPRKRPSTPPRPSRQRACGSRSTSWAKASRRSPRPKPPRRVYIALVEKIVAAGIDRNISLKPTQLGLDIDQAICIDNITAHSRPGQAARLLRPHRHGELALHPEDPRHVQRRSGRRGTGTRAWCCSRRSSAARRTLARCRSSACASGW